MLALVSHFTGMIDPHIIKHHCFDFFSLLISQTFCYGAFRARRKEAVPVKKKKTTQQKYEFLPLHSQIFPLLRPQIENTHLL